MPPPSTPGPDPTTVEPPPEHAEPPNAGPGAGGADRLDRAPSLPAGAAIALVALAVAVIQRGGYNPASRAVVLALAGASLLVTLVGRQRPSAPVVRALAAGWVVVTAAAAFTASAAGEGMGGAWEVAGLMGLFVAGAAAAAATPVPARPLLADALLVVGVVVGMSAWLGVVARITPIGYVVGGLWRGGSSLTYANAAAAATTMIFLLSLVRLAADRQARWLPALGTYLVGVGLVVTLSRAGYLALTVGLVVALVLGRGSGLWPVVVRQLVAVALAAGSVFPSLLDSRAPSPLLALGGLVVGALVAVGVDRRWSSRRRRLVGAVGAALLVLVLALQATSIRDTADDVGSERFGLGNDDRQGAWAAAWDLVVDSPVVGHGPATTDFYWSDGESAWTIKYVHNEYLELLATEGLVGALAALAAAALLVRAGWRADLGAQRPLRTGVLAALAGFLVHSGFDFLWHIPAVILLAGLIVGLVLPNMTTMRRE